MMAYKTEFQKSQLTIFSSYGISCFVIQDVLVNLMKAVTGSSNTKLIKLVLCTLIEFCQKSITYDANFVKRQLISYKVVRVGMV